MANKIYLTQTLEYKIAGPYQSLSFSKGFAIKKIKCSHGCQMPDSAVPWGSQQEQL